MVTITYSTLGIDALPVVSLSGSRHGQKHLSHWTNTEFGLKETNGGSKYDRILINYK